jgi:hypothetical protein
MADTLCFFLATTARSRRRCFVGDGRRRPWGRRVELPERCRSTQRVVTVTMCTVCAETEESVSELGVDGVDQWN